MLRSSALGRFLISVLLLSLSSLSMAMPGTSPHLENHWDNQDLYGLKETYLNPPLPGATVAADPESRFSTRGQGAVGTMAGAVAIQNGAANYSLPIATPPGVAGLVPQLAIQYSSGGGNGLLGVGGTLSGLSTIHRCAKTIHVDGLNKGTTFKPDDALCLDGQRLIRISGGADNRNAEYRTEIDSMMKITSHGNAAAGGPLYFKAWSKDGLVREFGNTHDARVVFGARVKGPVIAKPIVAWALNKVTDTVGNSIVYQYDKNETTGEHRPQVISYAGNRIEFSYEGRGDLQLGYRLGHRSEVRERLSRITVKSGTSVVMTYYALYEASGRYDATRLSGLKQCDSAGVCLPTSRFGWEDDYEDQVKVTWQTIQEGMALPSDERNVFTGDFDGDGFSDYVTRKDGQFNSKRLTNRTLFTADKAFILGSF